MDIGYNSCYKAELSPVKRQAQPFSYFIFLGKLFGEAQKCDHLILKSK